MQCESWAKPRKRSKSPNCSRFSPLSAAPNGAVGMKRGARLGAGLMAPFHVAPDVAPRRGKPEKRLSAPQAPKRM